MTVVVAAVANWVAAIVVASCHWYDGGAVGRGDKRQDGRLAGIILDGHLQEG